MKLNRVLNSLVLTAVVLTTTHPLFAPPTQEEVFKSISDNVSGPANGGPLLMGIGGVIAMLLAIAVFTNLRDRRKAVPRALLHHGKLMREVLKSLPLKSAEMKQLKLLADNENEQNDSIESPLTLLLCPSVLAKTVQRPPARLNRRLLQQLVRKMTPPADMSRHPERTAQS